MLYVDNDPIVSVHNDAMLAGTENVRSIQADFRQPGDILGHAALRELIHFPEPGAVLVVAVLHVIPDSASPAALLARFTELLPPGSYLALSQLTLDGDPAAVAQASGATSNTAIPLAFRSREQILSFFDGFDLVDPGLVSVHQWRPPSDTPPPSWSCWAE